MTQYQHSGHIPVAGFFLTLVAGGFTSVVLGLTYGGFIHECPFIYARFGGTCALGGVVGLAVGHSAFAGHIRNHLFVSASAILFAFVALYSAWAAFFIEVAGMNKIGGRAFDPLVMWQMGSLVLEKGTWGIGKKPVEIVRGPALGLTWLVEASAILGIALYVAHRQGSGFAYCEDCARWTKLHPAVRIFNATGQETYWKKAAEGELGALDEAPVGDAALAQSVRLELSICPRCKLLNVLTIREFTRTKNNKGEYQVKSRLIAGNILLTPTEAEFVRACGKVERIEESTEGESKDAFNFDRPKPNSNPFQF